MTEHFALDWLALREPFDHAARSVALAQRLADALPARRPRLMDLGAGTGSLFRFLAPIIGRGQDWVLTDADDTALDDAFGRTAAWARRQGFAATAEGDELLLSTPGGLWRIQARAIDLSASAAVDGADAVVCSALLDLVSRAWLARLLNDLRVPFLACLTVDGRDVWMPRHLGDTVVRSAFRRDQRRDKGFGRALGVTAPAVVLRGLRARGFATASAVSDWWIPRSALRMQHALIEGAAYAVGDVAARWQTARLRQAMLGRLAIRIGHRDILGLPKGG